MQHFVCFINKDYVASLFFGNNDRFALYFSATPVPKLTTRIGKSSPHNEAARSMKIYLHILKIKYPKSLLKITRKSLKFKKNAISLALVSFVDTPESSFLFKKIVYFLFLFYQSSLFNSFEAN